MNLPIDSNILEGDDRRYDSPSDAHMRLAKSIVRFEGKPVYVIEVDSDLKLVTWDLLPTQKYVKEINSNDKRLDISSIPLGFVNHKGEGYYVSRGPVRNQKQGINPHNLYYDSMTTGRGPGHGLSSNEFLIDIGVMCRGQYPDLDHALNLAKEGKSAAFSKTWGVRKTKDNSIFVLHHKTSPVGLYVKSEKLFLFQKDELNRVRERSLNKILAGMPGKDSYNVETSGL